MNSKIIGITGLFGSGKSTAADFFQSKGFQKITLSSFLEEEAKKRGETLITRKVLQDIGNEWRRKFGKGILAQKALEFIKKEKLEKIVIDGVRNVGEIEQLQKVNNFALLAIVCDRRIRFERLKRSDKREKITQEIFEKLDRRDLGLGEKETGLQVAYCLSLANVFIENNAEKSELINKLEKYYKNIKK